MSSDVFEEAIIPFLDSTSSDLTPEFFNSFSDFLSNIKPEYLGLSLRAEDIRYLLTEAYPFFVSVNDD
ncbi:MAG: hypothetical protein NZO16_07280 [Deltaproteobacteria bacterium]|nr:hypothetical protein [Deltaproteobacteria bacterium]